MQNKKLKILEITAFSSGACGVWTRTLAESRRLAKNNEVHVFSSNIKRGSEKREIAPRDEVIDNVKITRFDTKYSFGQNTFFWDFEKEALKLKPDVIVVHAYRQYYSTKALKIAKKLNIPCFLVTHAPFLDKKLRNWKLNLAVFIYDKFIGKRILNKYDKVLAITNWEIPYLLNIGCKKEKIIAIPNGVPEEFFTQKRSLEKKDILFFGRIAPIKNLEILIKSMKNTKFKLDIVGPEEESYKKQLEELVKKLNLKNVQFLPPVYNIKEKIALIDQYEIFVLPSKREAMPQALIEIMARGKIVISSKTEGGMEIIEEDKTGFLFEIGNDKELGEIFKKIENMPEKEKDIIKNNAKEHAKQYSWDKLIKRLEEIYFRDLRKSNI